MTQQVLWWLDDKYWDKGDSARNEEDSPKMSEIIAEATRRGAEQSAIDHAREGKIKALQYVKGHLLMNYCCVPDRCRNTKVPNKKCSCSKNRMLMGIVDDINQEMNAVLNQRYLRHL